MSIVINSRQKITISIVIFLFCIVSAKEARGSDPVAEARVQINTLAKKSDLTVTEWLAFIDDLDKKCEVESDALKKTALCSLYYEIYKLGELFSEQSPSVDDCDRALFTSKGLSHNAKTNESLNKIVIKLCPTK